MENHPADGPTCILKVSTCCLGRQWLPHFTKLWPPKFTKKKIAITCCKGCANKIKKKLQKVSGVNSITIDYEKGMVAVSGEVDPATILVTISKLNIMTELVSYKKDPRGAQKKKQAQRLKKTQNHHHKPKEPKKNGHDHHENPSSKSKSHSDLGTDDDLGQGHDHSAHKIRNPNMNAPFVAPQGNGYYPKPRPEFQPAIPYGPQNHWNPGMYGRLPPAGPPPAFPVPPPIPTPAYGYGSNPSMVPLQRPAPAYGYGSNPSVVPLQRPAPPNTYPYYQRPRDPPVGNSMLHYFSDDNTSSSSACTIM